MAAELAGIAASQLGSGAELCPKLPGQFMKWLRDPGSYAVNSCLTNLQGVIAIYDFLEVGR